MTTKHNTKQLLVLIEFLRSNVYLREKIEIKMVMKSLHLRVANNAYTIISDPNDFIGLIPRIVDGLRQVRLFFHQLDDGTINDLLDSLVVDIMNFDELLCE